MPYHVVEFITEALNLHRKALKGAKVLVLGVFYKKDIDDLRESPAITIIEALQKRGTLVSYNDPHFPKIGKGRKYDLQMQCVPMESLGQYDCVAIITDHSDYDYRQIVDEAQLVIDTRDARARTCSPKIVRC
jgi:UDP-N-acetyl-D-glucosamine dehydrogenase